MFLSSPRNKVRLHNGRLISVSEIKPGDLVQGQKGLNKVVDVKKTTRHFPLWELNQQVIFSADQLFLNSDGFWCAVTPSASGITNPGVKNVVPMNTNSDLIGRDEDCGVERLTALTEDAIYTCVELELSGDRTFFVNDYLVHNKGGGGTSTTTNEPPAYLQPYLTDIASKAQAAYGQVPTTPFSGQLVATPTAAQNTAIGQQLQVAGNSANLGDPTLALANDQAAKISSGYYTAPAKNLFQPVNLATKSAVDAYLQPVQQHLQQDILPQLKSQAVAQGAYGGSRFGTEEAKQINDNYTTTAANIAAQLGYGDQVRQQDQAFQSFQTNQGITPDLLKTEQAASLIQPQLAASGVQNNLIPSTINAQAGGVQQQQQQDLLDQAYQQYLLAVQGPFAGLEQYANVVNGAPGGGTATSSAHPASGGITGALSGAAGLGLGAYALGMSNPITAGAAILGGLLGGF